MRAYLACLRAIASVNKLVSSLLRTEHGTVYLSRGEVTVDVPVPGTPSSVWVEIDGGRGDWVSVDKKADGFTLTVGVDSECLKLSWVASYARKRT